MNTINWTNKAAKQLRKIADKKTSAAIYDEVQVLDSWPNASADIKRLQGRDDYRLRVGNYRVIFEIDTNNRPVIITIMQVEKRNERTY